MWASKEGELLWLSGAEKAPRKAGEVLEEGGGGSQKEEECLKKEIITFIK